MCSTSPPKPLFFMFPFRSLWPLGLSFFLSFSKLLLEDMLYNAVLVLAVQQRELAVIYTYPLFSEGMYFLPIKSHGALDRVPCAIRRFSLASVLCIGGYICPSKSPNSCHLLFFLPPLGVHTFVLYVCASISALQTGSFAPQCYLQYPGPGSNLNVHQQRNG